MHRDSHVSARSRYGAILRSLDLPWLRLRSDGLPGRAERKVSGGADAPMGGSTAGVLAGGGGGTALHSRALRLLLDRWGYCAVGTHREGDHCFLLLFGGQILDQRAERFL